MSIRLQLVVPLAVAIGVVVGGGTHLAAGARPVAARASSPAALAQSGRMGYREGLVPAGTVLRLRLDSTIRSDSNHVEDPVRAHLDEPVVIDGAIAIPAGSSVLGTITDVRRSNRSEDRSHVAMFFDTLRLGNDRYPIRTEMVGPAARAGNDRNVLDVVLPAAAGALLGDLIAGGKGAAIGGAIGVAAGAGYVLSDPGKEVRVGPGALVWVRLAEPLRMRTRSSW
jgi:hypothetical protein